MKVDDGEPTYFYILGIISSSLFIPDLTLHKHVRWDRKKRIVHVESGFGW